MLKNKIEKNIESQTIYFLTYKNFIHANLIILSTTRYSNIQNIDKKFKKRKKNLKI